MIKRSGVFLFSVLSASAVTLTVGPGQTYATIQAAANVANPGDIVSVIPQGGGYAGARMTLGGGQNQGTPGNPISFVAQSPSVATATYVSGISGASGTGYCNLTGFVGKGFGAGTTGTIAITSGTPGAITISAAGTGWTSPPTSAAVTSGTATCLSQTAVITATLSAVYITTPNSDGNGFSVNSRSYITINGFLISGMTNYGIDVVSCTGCQILNNFTGSSGGANILTGFGANLVIQGNETTAAGGGQHGIYVSNSDVPYNAPHIIGNISYANTGAGLQMNGDCSTLNGSNYSTGIITAAVVENNYIHDNSGNGMSLINVWYSLFRNNVIANHPGGGNIKLADQSGCNAGANYNVFVNNTNIENTATAANFRVVNNSNGSPFIGNIAFNSLVVKDSYACVIDATAANCDQFGSSGAGMYYYATYEASSISTPLFVNYALGTAAGYSLQSGSPCINLGTATATGFNSLSYNAPVIDYIGALRSGRYDAGAFEQGGTPAAPDTTPPTTPGTPSATVGATSVALTWGASTDLREVLWYVVYRNATAYGITYTNSWTDTTVTPGSTYTYTVYALNGSYLYSSASGGTPVTVYGQVGCLNSDATFRYVYIPYQSGSFTFTATVTPYQTGTDAFVALSPAIPVQFTGFATIVVFSNTGDVLARNGSSYTAVNVYPWTSGVAYYIVETVNIPAHTYSVTISTGGSPTIIATNYAFRTEQASATFLQYLATTDDQPGASAICSPAVNGLLLNGAQFISTITQNIYSQTISNQVVVANGTGYPLFDTPQAPTLTTSRSLTVADRAGLLNYTGSGNITVSVPTGLGAGFGNLVMQGGTGTITFVGSGLTLLSLGGATHTAGQYAGAVIQCTTADVCYLWGQVQ